MPIYEYKCKDCAEPFEVLVRSLNSPVQAVCPQCGGDHAEKVVSTVSALGGAETYGSSASACAPSG